MLLNVSQQVRDEAPFLLVLAGQMQVCQTSGSGRGNELR